MKIVDGGWEWGWDTEEGEAKKQNHRRERLQKQGGSVLQPRREFSAAHRSQGWRGHWQQQRGCLSSQREENQINADNVITLDASPLWLRRRPSAKDARENVKWAKT